MLAMLCAVVGTLSMGCPQPAGVAKVTTLFTSDSGSVANGLIAAFAKAEEVDVANIESLYITITEISLDYSGNAGNMEEGENEDGSSKIVVFPSPDTPATKTVDLVQLQDDYQLISLDEAPAGKYTKIRISFEDPVLTLIDPAVEISGDQIKLTANGRLFISQMFELPEGEETVLIVDFGGLHLVMNGNGDFTLTPQLQVDLEVFVLEEVVEMGTIVADSLDTDMDVFSLMTMDDEIEVDYSTAMIYKADGTEGTEADLMEGQEVKVTFLLYPDGVMVATSVEILPEPEPEEPPVV